MRKPEDKGKSECGPERMQFKEQKKVNGEEQDWEMNRIKSVRIGSGAFKR